MLLKGKCALVLGVANKWSLAWGIATVLHREGAELAFTYRRERSRDNLNRLLDQIGSRDKFPIYACDDRLDDHVKAVFDDLGRRWGRLHAVAHCIAHADRADLSSPLTTVSRNGYIAALDVSAYSLISIARCAAPLIETSGGGSIFTLTYDAVDHVASSYSGMAPAKAALEVEVRYLAAELGPRRVRVNAISAGPVRTLAGSAVRGLSKLQTLVKEAAPLHQNITIEDVGNMAAFLVSDLSQSVTGNVLFVDGGLHIVDAVRRFQDKSHSVTPQTAPRAPRRHAHPP